jgi:epidermal growth factor receptor substrate 15
LVSFRADWRYPVSYHVDSLCSVDHRDLADIRKEGKLNKDEFAVALYLINKKLGGIEVPTTLPNSLIPPSLRGGAEQQQQPSQTQRDLFDLFADSPPAATGPTQQTQNQTNNYFTPPLSATPTGQGQGRPQRAHLPGGTESFGPTFGK